MLRKLILFLLLLLSATSITLAQNSSKSKSKDRFREKDDPDNLPTILNVVSINSEEREMAPAYYENGIVFLSSRKSQKSGRQKNGEAYLNLYFAPFDPNGDPASTQDFGLNLNSSKNEGPVTFSRDFKTIYYTQNNNKNDVAKVGKDNQVHLKIYWAKQGRRDWEPQGEMPFSSDDYDCQTPSLSIDGKRMYFASNKPGGYGGFDIYYVEKNEFGNWTAPVNLGPGINTDQDDMSPSVTQAGTLFFASAGHNSLGRRDLFYANAAADGFGDVVNLDRPFNTEGDEGSIIVDFEGKRGFFVSDRDAGRKTDIYSFSLKKGIEGVEKPKVIPGEILVINAKTGEPIKGAAIHLLEPSDDGFVSGQKNFYSIDLLPVQDKKNALNFELVRKNAEDMGNPDLLTNLSGKAPTDFYRYRNYFVLVSMDGFQTAERLVTIDSKESGQLRFTLKEAPVCLKASGIVSTDKFGTRVANVLLKFVHKSTGYEEKVRSNSNGQYDACLPLEGQYLVYVEREHFKPENYQINAEKGRPDFQEVRLRPLDTEVANTAEEVMPLANGLAAGSVLVMDKIFYAYNKGTLNTGATRHLDALNDLMQQYPEMQIDLVVHTDTRGDAQLNQELTDERAKNAKAYLLHFGIASERINAYGRGETEPRNKCVEGVECTDAQHAENNRIEIKVRRLGTAVVVPPVPAKP